MLRGDRLKHLRQELNYTHERLAQLLDVSARQVIRYETGDSEPTAGIITRMADVFNVTSDFLLGRTNYPSPDFIKDDLTDQERDVIAALRRGEPLEAIRAIVCGQDTRN